MVETKNELRVGYQGSEGAYSQLAATQHFRDAPQALRCVGYHSFRQMLEALRAGEVDYAVLPIENSIAGSINESYDLLAKMGLSLVGEEFQPIAHCLKLRLIARQKNHRSTLRRQLLRNRFTHALTRTTNQSTFTR